MLVDVLVSLCIVIAGILFVLYIKYKGYSEPNFLGVVKLNVGGKPFPHSRKLQETAYTVWYNHGKCCLYKGFTYYDDLYTMTPDRINEAVEEGSLSALIKAFYPCNPVDLLVVEGKTVTIQSLRKQGFIELPFPQIPPVDTQNNHIFWVYKDGFENNVA